MNDLLRTFFIFSFAIVAFSQYLRTSSQQVVASIREKVRALDDTIGNDGEALLIKAQNNAHYNSKKADLFSEKCEVPSDTFWYYLMFFYLSCLLGFSAFEGLFLVLKINDWAIVQFTYSFHREMASSYVFIGLVINFLVFRAGFRAITPKENARSLFIDIENSFRTIMASR